MLTVRLARILKDHRPLALTAATALLLAGSLPATAKRLWVPVPTQKQAAVDAEPVSRAVLERGRDIYRQCIACHALKGSADSGVGPRLDGIVGSRAATREGYDYSRDLVRAGREGLVWTTSFLSEFLRNPASFLPEGKMAFEGLKAVEDRAAVIAYLETFEGEPRQIFAAVAPASPASPASDDADETTADGQPVGDPPAAEIADAANDGSTVRMPLPTRP